MNTSSTRFTDPAATPVASGENPVSSDPEESGLAALERLTLEELAGIASQEIGEARQLQADAVGLSRRSTATLYRAGRALFCARKKLKGKGKRAWTKWQKSHGIPVTSAWQAVRLYEEAESEGAVAGLTRSQALQKYGITKPKKVQPKQTLVEASMAPEANPIATGEVASPDTPGLRLVSERDDQAGSSVADRNKMATHQAEVLAQPQAAPTTPPAAEVLLIIVRQLEILEQDCRGIDLGNEVYTLIDQGIATLRRLRGEAA